MTAQARLAAMLRRKSTSKGGRSSVTSFMKLSPTTKNAVAASMAAMPLRSELLSMDAVYINVQGAKNMAMDTIADDGLCRTAGRGMRATFTMRASARPRYASCGPKVSPVLRACAKRTGKFCFGCQRGRSKSDFLSQTVQNRLELASAPKHLKPDIAKVAVGSTSAANLEYQVSDFDH